MMTRRSLFGLILRGRPVPQSERVIEPCAPTYANGAHCGQGRPGVGVMSSSQSSSVKHKRVPVRWEPPCACSYDAQS